MTIYSVEFIIAHKSGTLLEKSIYRTNWDVGKQKFTVESGY